MSYFSSKVIAITALIISLILYTTILISLLGIEGPATSSFRSPKLNHSVRSLVDQTKPWAFSESQAEQSFTDLNGHDNSHDIQLHRHVPRRPNRSIATIDNTHITIINATPYIWRRTAERAYQLKKWATEWPEFVYPGEATTMQVQLSESWFPKKSTAEVTYQLENTTVPMSFQVQYREGRRHKVYVRYLENMRSDGSGHLSEHNLGFSRSPGGVGFIIAGTEDRFIGANPPINWMQSQLDVVGDFPLHEVVLPRSHHAGSYKISKLKGVATPKNTQTQRMPLYEQLVEGGIRVLDVRPSYHKGRFWESHGTFVAGLWNGMLGASIDDMVTQINRFNEDYPGELIILDIHQVATSGASFRGLNSMEREKLYAELMKLKYRRDVAVNRDLTRLTLRDFLYNNNSAVLVRVHSSWIRKGGKFPDGAEGFVTELNFPVNEHWSDMSDPASMARDQIDKLEKYSGSRFTPVYRSDWLLTQQGLGVAFPLDSITDLARGAWRTLHSELWPALNDHMYPNWLAMDDIHNAQLKSFVMAVNHCLVAKMCGSLGTKVNGSTIAL